MLYKEIILPVSSSQTVPHYNPPSPEEDFVGVHVFHVLQSHSPLGAANGDCRGESKSYCTVGIYSCPRQQRCFRISMNLEVPYAPKTLSLRRIFRARAKFGSSTRATTSLLVDRHIPRLATFQQLSQPLQMLAFADPAILKPKRKLLV
ncbi:hypothetical protein KC329_g74 [Hortaea werneckii]|nr:hypothetical protein KC329_g74 [Hortaea werneckii]